MAKSRSRSPSNSQAASAKGGLEEGHGKRSPGKGHGTGDFRKGKGKRYLRKGKGKGGLKKGKGKGGLRKGHGKGGLEKNQGKGGLRKSHFDPQLEAHDARIEEEIASGFDPGWQESRGRSSKWARKDRRKTDPQVNARRAAWQEGKRLETKPEPENMKEGPRGIRGSWN